MAQRNLDGLLLFSPHNVFYLSGMDSENLFDFQCLIVPAEGEPVLVILDFEEARAANSVGAGRPVSYHAFDDPIEAVLAQLEALDLTEARLGLESRAGITPAAYARFADGLAGAVLEDPFGIVENARLVKSPAEIAYMRRSAALTDAATLAAYDVLRPGVATPRSRRRSWMFSTAAAATRSAGAPSSRRGIGRIRPFVLQRPDHPGR